MPHTETSSESSCRAFDQHSRLGPCAPPYPRACPSLRQTPVSAGCNTRGQAHGSRPAALSATARSFGASAEGSGREVFTGSELRRGPQTKLQSPGKASAAAAWGGF